MIQSFPLPAVVIDLETSGANVSYDRIIEIGIVEVDADGTTREWSSLVNPGKTIPTFIEELTGITNEALSQAWPYTGPVALRENAQSDPVLFP